MKFFLNGALQDGTDTLEGGMGLMKIITLLWRRAPTNYVWET